MNFRLHLHRRYGLDKDVALIMTDVFRATRVLNWACISEAMEAEICSS